jgi:hypothetical protein
MAEITYLLGAGASYGTLPLVNQMHSNIINTIKWFEDEYKNAHPRLSHLGKPIEPRGIERLKNIFLDLEWLREMCDISNNISVDTFARKLKLSENKNEYDRLKNILSFYFTIEQKRNKPNARYGNFWASILKSRFEFPENIKIISWNYDFQLELTYQEFSRTDSLKAASKALNISSLETKRFNTDKKKCFEIFKLNGSATFSSKQVGEPNYWVDNFREQPIDEFIESLIESYKIYSSNKDDMINHLSFAWDHQTDNAFYQNLKESVSNTEILVVIGYSFPFFNKDIDKLILNEFMGKSLKKVYFQAPDAEDLRERFLAINNDESLELVLRTDPRQFTLPNEL